MFHKDQKDVTAGVRGYAPRLEKEKRSKRES
jgi:hypothetical protein